MWTSAPLYGLSGENVTQRRDTRTHTSAGHWGWSCGRGAWSPQHGRYPGEKSGEPVIIALSRSGSLTPPDDFLVQPPNISRLYISSGQLLATSILVVAYQCPCGAKENLPPRGPSAGCIGVRGCRWVRDRRLSVDASLDTRIFTPHLHL